MTVKKVLKTFLFLFFAAFLFDKTIELFYSVYSINPINLDVFTSLFLAVLINLFVTGIFAFTGFVLPTSKILPSAYYRVNSPKKVIFWYDFLQVKYFTHFLLWVFWGAKKKPKEVLQWKKIRYPKFYIPN